MSPRSFISKGFPISWPICVWVWYVSTVFGRLDNQWIGKVRICLFHSLQPEGEVRDLGQLRVVVGEVGHAIFLNFYPALVVMSTVSAGVSKYILQEDEHIPRASGVDRLV